MEVGVALRNLGLVLLCQGDLRAAQSVLERALADYVPERDVETQLRFGRDTEVNAASYLAVVGMAFGRGRARPPP